MNLKSIRAFVGALAALACALATGNFAAGAVGEPSPLGSGCGIAFRYGIPPSLSNTGVGTDLRNCLDFPPPGETG